MKVNFYKTNFEIDTPVWTNYVVEYEDIEEISIQKETSKSIRIGGLGNLKVSMGSFENDEYGKYTRYTYNSCDVVVIILRVDGTYVLLNDIDEQTTKTLYEQIKSRVGDSANQ
ncbi:PH domain-containing protein [Floccifex sp.]|uniref:PH domain-containing protein n=1 Tax=Floccifex sp. TaxID=2815810 RepID=UPI003F094C4E